MAETAVILVGLVLNGLGIVGAVMPGLPGPLLSWLSLLLFLLLPGHDIGFWALAVTGVLMALVSAVDYLLPVMGAKRFGSSREGVIGGAIGIVAGMFFFPPVGIILGPFVGTVIGDLIAGGTIAAALNSGLGALIGFLVSTALKLAYCIAVLLLFFYHAGGIVLDAMSNLL